LYEQFEKEVHLPYSFYSSIVFKEIKDIFLISRYFSTKNYIVFLHLIRRLDSELGLLNWLEKKYKKKNKWTTKTWICLILKKKIN
jgi:hypothetical protein